jgi:transcriptional regulator with XRE-family HTH domain
MNMAEATKERIAQLCHDNNITFCKLAALSGIPYSTVKAIIYGDSKNPGVVTIKKICDGLDISITEFFNTETFKNLEQEIK